ncbi:MAG: c-type cytochrome [Bryobacteraceae bacterium]
MILEKRKVVLAFALGAGLIVAGGCKREPKGDPALIARGKSIFEDQCALCHDPATTEKKVGPGLKGLFQRSTMENGKPLTEASIRENIDTGSQNMPSFKDTLTPAEKDALIAFLKTL